MMMMDSCNHIFTAFIMYSIKPFYPGHALLVQYFFH